ncbi:hypothetical protein [Pedobacter duraquae]|uniref:Uncharacterized protein n=1 Tax=Pedobacter duraquae TaxID=425511 RepID=A0A4R6IQG0_9SPHI|nr:hypothetical protein [Pedobacter duraquae]TDO24266.1 hypothetical protein CLV32_0555 [Pedobacter duraquae]
MENKKEQEMEQDEIVNLEQFQVGRAPEEEKQHDEEDDSDYTEDEVEFADGEGTQLEEEFAADDDFEDLEDDDLDTDDLPEDDSLVEEDDEEEI